MDRRQFFTVASSIGLLSAFYACSRQKNRDDQYEITSNDNLLFIPPLLYEPLTDFYQFPDILIKNTFHHFFSNQASKAIGLSTSEQVVSYLGPTIKFKRGDVAGITVKNQTNEATMNHWHGLHIPSHVDGSPHQLIEPGESWQVTMHIQQEAATCWYHPLNYGVGSKQLYSGYAGMIIIEDDNSNTLNLPTTYGLDDIPLIFQDKSFNANGQLVYNRSSNKSFQGNTLVVNGTVSPYISVAPGWVRLRLLNASNSRIFELSFSEKTIFYKIASDGGLLNKPIAMTTVTLAPEERCEIMVFLKEKQSNIAMLAMDKVDTSFSMVALKITVEDIACTETVLPNQLRSSKLAVNYALANLLPIKKQITIQSNSLDSEQLKNNTLFAAEKIEDNSIREEDEIWEISLSGVYSFHVYGGSFLIISINGQEPGADYSGWRDTLTFGGSLDSKTHIKKIKILIKFYFYTYRQGVNRFQARIYPMSLKHHVPYLYYCHSLEQSGVSKIGQFSVTDKA
ncbi:multicopper oxidase domain-containing protein [Spartinivicinus poritis]|uniref:Multicopper oxidase domain-containing protein n=1 Tax=Spartinivicinus poritis TaxID=2994640 RepID=A0ABT5UDF5_9GAMM|nr:multicopper oxidase domain-containing protein [Spartinivicinus sp. A2-2]MDE1464407.1 multicopper oxidase domain-containing protein [Spartinivicinus sp. A2-2]